MGRRRDAAARPGQQLARLQQAQLLLVLQRAERGDGLEVAVEGRHAHGRLSRQVFDGQRLRELAADAPDDAVDARQRRDVGRQLAHSPVHAAIDPATVDWSIHPCRHALG